MSTSDLAIKVENVSKVYRIGVKEQIHDSLGGTLIDFIKSPLENYRKYRSLYIFDDIDKSTSDSKSSDIIWALRDVSFEVEQGQALGIIGRNGAGKSTLLKILSRITPPTRGCVEIRGRISSLLEVGTGFHQELTGRENVYLNGTILGMKKYEVDRKFDEIVDFSGVEKFLDTPVKRYSSGMKVRLAFAVAAHLEPNILIVDEVLAVGDAAFQRKCLNKMQDVEREGRTVLFVSHNIPAMIHLCDRAIWLEDGRPKLSGSATDVASSYLMAGTTSQGTWLNPSGPANGQEVQLQSVRVLSMDNQPIRSVDFDNSFKVEIGYEILCPVRDLAIVYRLIDATGNIVFESTDNDTTHLKSEVRIAGKYLSTCNLPSHLLKPGRYYITALAYIDRVKFLAKHENVVAFDISPVGCQLHSPRLGFVTPVLEWNVVRADKEAKWRKLQKT